MIVAVKKNYLILGLCVSEYCFQKYQNILNSEG